MLHLLETNFKHILVHNVTVPFDYRKVYSANSSSDRVHFYLFLALEFATVRLVASLTVIEHSMLNN